MSACTAGCAPNVARPAHGTCGGSFSRNRMQDAAKTIRRCHRRRRWRRDSNDRAGSRFSLPFKRRAGVEMVFTADRHQTHPLPNPPFEGEGFKALADMNPIEATNDFVVKFANINGSGSASANELFAKCILRMGV